MQLKIKVPISEWRSPAKGEKVYAQGKTPIGDVTLTRQASANLAVHARADAWEDWKVGNGDTEYLLVRDFGAPGVLSQRLLKRGLAGQFEGEVVKVAVNSSISRKSRYVRFDFPRDRLTFLPYRLGVHLINHHREIIAIRQNGQWEFSGSSPKNVLTVCLFEWGEMDYFLRNPLIRQL
ncbi:hypothetical protein [Streptomyces sp. NPDC057545]|uniref:hypothetical protein n=1 Tax=Streptomyces sp. NPDC057545 TaxID=3346164 RepID=UPI0036866DBE